MSARDSFRAFRETYVDRILPLLSALALACGSSSSDGPGVDRDSVPASLIRQTAQTVQAQVDTAVMPPPAVLVRDGSGRPMASVQVAFAVAAGGGTVYGPIVETDASGIAAVGGWVLGPMPGPNELTATVTTPRGTLTEVFTVAGKARPTFPPDGWSCRTCESALSTGARSRTSGAYQPAFSP